jgi:hypothetical protein
MRSRKLFWACLTAFVLLHLCYGLKRLTLGIDFTDEGAYVSWPMRMLFGEKSFTSELAALLRPLVAYLYLAFKLHPAMTLYEFRLLGWSLHLLAFAVLSIYLFRLSDAPLQSPLLASVPFFICNIFGLASPSYNSLSSDFLLLALSLRGLAFLEGVGWKTTLNLCSGLALYLATMAHAALGLVAAVLLLRELLSHDLAQNLRRRRLTASNLGVLVFVACWLAFFLHLASSGAAASWIQRTGQFRSFSVAVEHTRAARVYLLLATYPFSYSRFALLLTGAALTAIGALVVFLRQGDERNSGRALWSLAFLLIVSLIFSFSYESGFLHICFAQACLIMIGLLALRLAPSVPPVDPETRFLVLLSGLGAVCYTAFTFYFSPSRSWMSGILALPFAFTVGLTLLLRARPAGSVVHRLLITGSLLLAVASAAQEHYWNIYRDAVPAELQTSFHIPKLVHIKSTVERVRSLEALYAHLHPKLTRGETLLAFDSCPMLYYLFDAKPVYGLTWAVRYTQSPAALRQLNRELNSEPLPHYAIRTLVDLSLAVWSTAPRTDYADYPLNETVLANYELERTIFPFEVWRLKPANSREKTSPDPPGR